MEPERGPFDPEWPDYLDQETVERLAEPFPPDDVSLVIIYSDYDQNKVLVTGFVNARAVMQRLDDVVGPGNWSDQYRIIADEMRVTRIDRKTGEEITERVVEVDGKLTVMGVTKSDAGESDTVKGAYSDTLKRNGVKWGIGRYLRELPSVMVPGKRRGRRLVISNEKDARRQFLKGEVQQAKERSRQAVARANGDTNPHAPAPAPPPSSSSASPEPKRKPKSSFTAVNHMRAKAREFGWPEDFELARLHIKNTLGISHEFDVESHQIKSVVDLLGKGIPADMVQ